jgi:hypothetical protein
MKLIAISLFFMGALQADTIFNFSISPNPAISMSSGTVQGTVDCAFITGSGSCGITLTSLPTVYGTLYAGNQVYTWAYVPYNNFVLNSGSLVSAVVLALNYPTWAAAIAANHPLDVFSVNTTGANAAWGEGSAAKYLTSLAQLVPNGGAAIIQDDYSFDGIAFPQPTTSTPEPGAFWLVALGVLLIGYCGWRGFKWNA